MSSWKVNPFYQEIDTLKQHKKKIHRNKTQDGCEHFLFLTFDKFDLAVSIWLWSVTETWSWRLALSDISTSQSIQEILYGHDLHLVVKSSIKVFDTGHGLMDCWLSKSSSEERKECELRTIYAKMQITVHNTCSY